MRIFGKDFEDLKSMIFPPDPFKEQLKEWGEPVTIKANKRLTGPIRSDKDIDNNPSKLDFRPIKGFGDLFTLEVYDRVHRKRSLGIKMMELKNKWQPQSEVFFLNYGQGICGVLGSMTGAYITHHFRRVLLLGHKARISMYSGAVYFPLLFCGGINGLVTSNRALTGNECLICNGLFSGLIQSTLSVFPPFAYNAVSGLYFAQRHWTVGVLPHAFFTNKSGRRQALKVLKQLCLKKGGVRTWAVIFAVQFVIGYYIGVQESEECINIYYRLLKEETETLKVEEADRLKKEMFDKANRGAATVGQVIDPSGVMVDMS